MKLGPAELTLSECWVTRLHWNGTEIRQIPLSVKCTENSIKIKCFSSFLVWGVTGVPQQIQQKWTSMFENRSVGRYTWSSTLHIFTQQHKMCFLNINTLTTKASTTGCHQCSGWMKAVALNNLLVYIYIMSWSISCEPHLNSIISCRVAQMYTHKHINPISNRWSTWLNMLIFRNTHTYTNTHSLCFYAHED